MSTIESFHSVIKFFFRWDLTKSENYYNQAPMALTLADVKNYASDKNQFCRKDMPLLDVPLSKIVLEELHLLLQITDILLSNLIEESMELDDKKDFLKKRGNPKESAYRSSHIS